MTYSMLKPKSYFYGDYAIDGLEVSHSDICVKYLWIWICLLQPSGLFLCVVIQ